VSAPDYDKRRHTKPLSQQLEDVRARLSYLREGQEYSDLGAGPSRELANQQEIRRLEELEAELSGRLQDERFDELRAQCNDLTRRLFRSLARDY